MKKRNIIVIGAAAFLIAALVFSLSKTGRDFIQRFAQKNPSQKSQSVSEHVGHTGGGIPSKVQTDVLQTEETPTVEIPLDKQQLIGVKIAEVNTPQKLDNGI